MAKYWPQSNQTVRFDVKVPHGTLPCAATFFSEPASSASSPALTAGWSDGLSRTQRKKKTAHTTPRTPNHINAERHETKVSTHATNNGVKAPPQRALNHMMPWARTRSFFGSQMVNALVRFGKQPASPIPKKKRKRTS